jgi:hypothetical protein
MSSLIVGAVIALHVINVNPEQPLNARNPIEVTELGILIEVKLSQ